MPRHTNIQLLALLLALTTAPPAAPAEQPTIEHVADLTRLPNTNESSGIPVHVTATITRYDPRPHHLFVREGTASVYVAMDFAGLPPAARKINPSLREKPVQ